MARGGRGACRWLARFDVAGVVLFGLGASETCPNFFASTCFGMLVGVVLDIMPSA